MLGSSLARLLILAEILGFIFSLCVISSRGLEGLAAMAIGAVRATVLGVDMVWERLAGRPVEGSSQKGSMILLTRELQRFPPLR
jgi:hypothetical protein